MHFCPLVSCPLVAFWSNTHIDTHTQTNRHTDMQRPSNRGPANQSAGIYSLWWLSLLAETWIRTDQPSQVRRSASWKSCGFVAHSTHCSGELFPAAGRVAKPLGNDFSSGSEWITCKSSNIDILPSPPPRSMSENIGQNEKGKWQWRFWKGTNVVRNQRVCLPSNKKMLNFEGPEIVS